MSESLETRSDYRIPSNSLWPTSLEEIEPNIVILQDNGRAYADKLWKTTSSVNCTPDFQNTRLYFFNKPLARAQCWNIVASPWRTVHFDDQNTQLALVTLPVVHPSPHSITDVERYVETSSADFKDLSLQDFCRKAIAKAAFEYLYKIPEPLG